MSALAGCVALACAEDRGRRADALAALAEARRRWALKTEVAGLLEALRVPFASVDIAWLMRGRLLEAVQAAAEQQPDGPARLTLYSALFDITRAEALGDVLIASA